MITFAVGTDDPNDLEPIDGGFTFSVCYFWIHLNCFLRKSKIEVQN